MIPKIIHQTGPKDRKKWHPIWECCHESWKINFREPEYKHIMWTDEDIYDLISTHYKQYLNLYNSFPKKIIKVDFARFCILDYMGGIYADLDIYCYANFYNVLNKPLSMIEGLKEMNEKVQNSLMCSVPKHKFWQKCFDYTLNYSKTVIDNITKKEIFEYCGPIALSKIEDDIYILPKHLYNPYWTHPKFLRSEKNINKKKQIVKLFKDEIKKTQNRYITRHFVTSVWLSEIK